MAEKEGHEKEDQSGHRDRERERLQGTNKWEGEWGGPKV